MDQFFIGKEVLDYLKVEKNSDLSEECVQEILMIFIFIVFDIFNSFVPVRFSVKFIYENGCLVDNHLFFLSRKYTCTDSPLMSFNYENGRCLGIIELEQFGSIRAGFADAFELKKLNVDLFNRICISISLMQSTLNDLSEVKFNPITIIILRQVYEILILDKGKTQEIIKSLCTFSSQFKIDPVKLNKDFQRLGELRHDIVHGSYYHNPKIAKTNMLLEIENAETAVIQLIRLLLAYKGGFDSLVDKDK